MFSSLSFSKKLGTGSTGSVNEYFNKTGDKFALKKIKKKDHRFELEILEKIKGVNGLLQLHSCSEKGDEILIYTESVPGQDLFDAIHAGLKMQDVKDITKDLLRSLVDLHSLEIVHRDLKPENIRVWKEKGVYKAKILDFGLSRFYDGKKHSAAGTKYYVAPEAINGDMGPYNDVWSLGIIVYAMTTGGIPWKSTSLLDILDEVKRMAIDLSSVPGDTKIFLRKILRDRKWRMSAKELLDDVWFVE